MISSAKILRLISLAIFVLIFLHTQAQEPTKEEKKELRKVKKQEKIESGKLMITPLAGPAYTPELGFTLAGGIMTSFKTNKNDTLIQRSSAPIMLGITSTGAYFLQSKWTTFWLEDKMRIYVDANFKSMPDNYYGVGFDAGQNTVKSDTTTEYTRTWVQFYPKVLWQFQKNWFAGGIVNINYTSGDEASEGVSTDPYYIKYNENPFNSGLGAIFQYDSRDVPVNAWKGMFVELSATYFGAYVGGQNNYQEYNIDIRKYKQIKRPGRTVALQLRGRFGFDDMPYGEMSQPGTPFDLRGYSWGRYRDNAMVFALAEYRHMFLKKNKEMSPHGIVLFAGVGTIGQNISNLTGSLPCFGLGYRFEVQPRMNLRIDYGFGFESQGFYFNFNEAY